MAIRGRRKRDTVAILVGRATPWEGVQFLKNPHHEGTALDVWNSEEVCVTNSASALGRCQITQSGRAISGQINYMWHLTY